MPLSLNKNCFVKITLLVKSSSIITYQKFVDSKSKGYFFYDCQCYTENMRVTDPIKDHNGCVNTIKWDKTGTRSPSDGDDTILRINQYMRDYDEPWVKNVIFHVTLPTPRNILSAKFTPIYNEKTVSVSNGTKTYAWFIDELEAGSERSLTNNIALWEFETEGYHATVMESITTKDLGLLKVAMIKAFSMSLFTSIDQIKNLKGVGEPVKV